MIHVLQLQTIDDIIRRWPRLRVLAKAERVTADVKDDSVTLQMFLNCMMRGAVFVVSGDKGMIGFASVEVLDDVVWLRSIPSGFVPNLARVCLDAVAEWCKKCHYDKIQCMSNRMNGSTNKYFKGLGFSLHSVTFIKKVS